MSIKLVTKAFVQLSQRIRCLKIRQIALNLTWFFACAPHSFFILSFSLSLTSCQNSVLILFAYLPRRRFVFPIPCRTHVLILKSIIVSKSYSLGLGLSIICFFPNIYTTYFVSYCFLYSSLRKIRIRIHLSQNALP